MSFETKITLRVYSEKLTLKEINDTLGDPSDGCSIGDIYTKNGKKREHTYWGLESKQSATNPPHLHILEILKFVAKNDKKINELKQKECTVDISCFLDSNNGQGSFSLSSDIMKTLAEKELQITFDFYSD